MKTDAEKRAHLKAEGWDESFDYDFGGEWEDPKNQDDGHSFGLDDAFGMATKRKAARDRARLRKAGFEFHEGKWCRDGGFGVWYGYTKQQAIAYLDSMENKSKGIDKPLDHNRGLSYGPVVGV